MNIEEIIEEIAENEPDILTADGLHDAIVGTADVWECGLVFVYDVEKIIGIFMKRDGMSREEAEEFFEFNVQGAYVGKKTPIFLRPLTDE